VRSLKARLAAVERLARGAPRVPRRPAKLVGPALAIEIVVPLRVVSELNTRGHWSRRHRRAAAARDAWLLTLHHFGLRGVEVQFPAVVTFRRLGGRKLDSDNLVGAFKHLRDAVSDWMGCDDGDESKVVWVYGEQHPGGPCGVCVRVECGGVTGT
jgi:hypothetical protein